MGLGRILSMLIGSLFPSAEVIDPTVNPVTPGPAFNLADAAYG